MGKRDFEGDGFEFSSDFGWSGPVGRMSDNVDVQLAEDRDVEARMAAESPDAESIMRAAGDLLDDQFQLLKQTVKNELSARGISCPVTVGWAKLDSDLSGETSAGSYSVVCYLTSNVTAGGSGYTVAEAALDIIQKVDAMLGDAAPFRLVPLTNDGPRAA